MSRPLSLEKILNRATGRNMQISLYYCYLEIWGEVRHYRRHTHADQKGWLLQMNWQGPQDFFLAEQDVEFSDHVTRFDAGNGGALAHCRVNAFSTRLTTVPVLLSFSLSRVANQSDFEFIK